MTRSKRLLASSVRLAPSKAAKKDAKAAKSSNDVASEEGSKRYWLFKSEPLSRKEEGVEMKFSIDDLEKEDDSTACWDGVRNYQARNLMKQMQPGELGFFYHSNCPNPGIVGIVEVVREAYPDHTSWDVKDPHFDPKSSSDNPRWFMVDVKLVRKFTRLVSLKELKSLFTVQPELQNMVLLKQGRLSVQPVDEAAWNYILKLEQTES